MHCYEATQYFVLHETIYICLRLLANTDVTAAWQL